MKRTATIAALIVLVIVLCFWLRGRTEKPTATPDRADPPAELSVIMGEASGIFRKVNPARYGIRYPAFYMLETEVTNAQFKQYLAATRNAKDDTEVLKIVEERESNQSAFSTASVVYSVGDKTGLWRNSHYPDGRDDHPVALVTLADAQGFCQWLTERHPELGLFRLPTWNEWMIAAYGRARNYPWGNEWQTDRVHTSYGFVHDIVVEAGKSVIRDERPKKTEPVKARPQGRTPEGLYGILGNVQEYIVEDDPTNKDYFNLGSRWMGAGFTAGWDWSDNRDSRIPPRRDYWGYSHHAVNREADLGFRVILDPTADKSLLLRKRLFDQNDTSWIVPPEK